MGLVSEFKEFALKGNVMDMAIGTIIGGAFGGIVKSVIEDMLMPVVGMFGKADFSNMYLPLSDAVKQGQALADARAAGPVLAYGNFITIVINFLILAACIFMVVKVMNKLKRQQAAAPAPAAPPEPPADVKLLSEIRDLLKSR